MRNVLGQFLGQHIHELLVQQVAFGDGQYALLVQQFGVEGAHLAQQDVVFLGYGVGVTGHHEEQQRVALDVAQESQSQSASFGCPFYDAGDVSHDE